MYDRPSYRELVRNNSGKGVLTYFSEKAKTIVGARYPIESLDTYYTLSRGLKLCSSYVEDELEEYDVETVFTHAGKLIEDIYLNKWSSLIEATNISTEIISPSTGYIETIEETITDDGTTESNGTDETVNKVSAYDDEDFVNNNTDTRTTNNSNTNNNERIRSYTRKGSQNIASSIKSNVDYLSNDYICDIIFNDVDNIMTIGVFDIN